MSRTHHGCAEYQSLVHPSRRDALRLGILGGLGVTLPGVLQREAMADSTTPTARVKSVILLWVQGGVSHHETFDPKPDAPADVRGAFKTIPSNLPGVRVSEHIPKLSKILDKLAVIRSVRHVEAGHERGSMYMVEGRRPPLATGTSHSGNPELGAMVAHQLGMRNGLPAFVSHPGNDFTSHFTGTGWLPATSAAYRGYQAASLTPNQKISPQTFTERNSLRDQFDPKAASAISPSFDRFRQQAVDILSSGKAAAAFDVTREPEPVRSLYGIQPKVSDNMGELCLAARRLVEAGVRFVTVGRNSWDYHEKIFPSLKERLPYFDAAFSGLVLDLDQRGMLDETLVVYLTEYGRTPRVNEKGGRDHWPNAFSVAFAGAGIRTGQVIGASDRIGAEVKDQPVSPEQLAATILHLVGINPQTEVRRADGRPMSLIDEAKPLPILLS